MNNPEVFEHRLGSCVCTELQVADEVGGSWLVEDLDGYQICWIQHFPNGWKRTTPFAGQPRGRYESFEAALDAHVDAIDASGGLQTDELFWQGAGLPRWV